MCVIPHHLFVVTRSSSDLYLGREVNNRKGLASGPYDTISLLLPRPAPPAGINRQRTETLLPQFFLSFAQERQPPLHEREYSKKSAASGGFFAAN
jgi:hypothetical protein